MAKTPTDIKSLARVHTALALRVLKEVAGSPKANHAARVAASVALLDRGWGKPKQELEVGGEAFAGLWAAVVGTSRVAPELTEDDSDSQTTH